MKVGDRPVLVALSTLQMEWSEGWGANPAIVAGMVANSARRTTSAPLSRVRIVAAVPGESIKLAIQLWLGGWSYEAGVSRDAKGRELCEWLVAHGPLEPPSGFAYRLILWRAGTEIGHEPPLPS